MSLSFTVVTTPADRVAVELLAVPIAKGAAFGPGADVVDTALGGGLGGFLAEAASRASWARRSRCRPREGSGPRPPSSWGSATPTELTVDGLRRAAAAVARRASKATSVATTLATAGRGST